MNYFQRKCISVLLCVTVITFTACANSNNTSDTSKNAAPVAATAADDNGGLKLPSGFSSTIIADGLGRARHLAVNNNGDIYIKLEKLRDGKGILLLRKGTGDKYNIASSFGNYIGTGMAIKNGYLYASSNTA